MKKLPITKEAFEKSNYFKNKYGKLKYVSESGKLFKTNKGKVLMFKESFDEDEPLQEFEVGEKVNIDVWQLQYELDDDDLADLPETGWEIEAVDRDDYYDDCDGYRYTIVHTRHDDWQFEVSSSALKKRKPIRKGRLGKKFVKEARMTGNSDLLLVSSR